MLIMISNPAYLPAKSKKQCWYCVRVVDVFLYKECANK